MLRACLVTLPIHFSRPVRFAMLSGGDIERMARDFRYVQAGFLAVPHLSADLYQMPDDAPTLPTLDAFRRISIIDPARVDPLLLRPPALHPERSLLTDWLGAANDKPDEMWVRHLPVFIRATMRELAPPEDRPSAIVLMPDAAFAAMRGDNDNMDITGFCDAAKQTVEPLTREGRIAGPALAPLNLIGCRSKPRGGVVSRLEALLADIGIRASGEGEADERGVVFDDGLLRQALAMPVDRIRSADQRDHGVWEFPVLIADHAPTANALLFSSAVVRISTDPATPALTVEHYACRTHGRVSPGTSEAVVKALGQSGMPVHCWDRLMELVSTNDVPFIAFDENGRIMRPDDAPIAGLASETSHLIDPETTFDLRRGLLKKSLFDLPIDPEQGLSIDHQAMFHAWLGRPIDQEEQGAAIDPSQVAEGDTEGGKEDEEGIYYPFDLPDDTGRHQETDGEAAIPFSDHGQDAGHAGVTLASPGTVSDANGTDIEQQQGDDNESEIDPAADTGASEVEGAGEAEGDEEDIEFDMEPTGDDDADGQIEDGGQDDESGRGEQGGDDRGDARLANVPSTPADGGQLDPSGDAEAPQADAGDAILPFGEDYELTPEEAVLFRFIVSQERTLKARPLTDRHRVIEDVLRSIALDPEEFVRDRTDEPNGLEVAEMIRAAWESNALLRRLALMLCEQSMPEGWNLDGHKIAILLLAQNIKRARKFVESAIAHQHSDNAQMGKRGSNAP